MYIYDSLSFARPHGIYMYRCMYIYIYIERDSAQHTSAYVSIRQHTSAYVSIRQHTSPYVSIRQHTSAIMPAWCTPRPLAVNKNKIKNTYGSSYIFIILIFF